MRQTALASAPPAWLLNSDHRSSPAGLTAALLFALLFHGVILLTLSFSFPEPGSDQPTTRPLEVVVLRHAAPRDRKPETPDAYAQVDREGGGTDDNRESIATRELEPSPEPVPPLFLPPTEVLPAQQPPAPSPEPIAAPVPVPDAVEEPSLTAEIDQLETQAAPPLAEFEPEPPVEPPRDREPPAVTAAQILASRSLEIARLTARIEQNSTAYANRPRRKAISASTRKYKFANYLETWRRKVEQIGNLNYPEAAKSRKLYGNLILHVAVRADGSLEQVRILRSSGYDVLDQAAVDIVKLAAPYAPFPADIKAEADILDITRTWQFLSNNQLGWDN